MTKQKDTLIQLNELSERIALYIKQYNDLARSQSLDSRLAYGHCEPYKGDNKAQPVAIDIVDSEEEEDSWSNSSSCEWQDSGCSF